MIDKSEFKYDVAISFLRQDEEIALELYDMLKNRLDVFYYADKQETLVGKDGEEEFGRVFRDSSRVVVVLYRREWGTTPFTRAEQAAIKQRSFSNSYDFTVWVPLDEDKALPPYVDPQYIWFDFERFGVKALAAIVEKRVRESGREVRAKSRTDDLRDTFQRIETRRQRKDFVDSMAGVSFFTAEQGRVGELIAFQVDRLNGITEKIKFSLKRERNEWVVRGGKFICLFTLEPFATNSIREARLQVSEYEELDRFKHTIPNRTVYEPTLDWTCQPAWTKDNEKFHFLESIVEDRVLRLAERVYREIETRFS